jgi:transposase
MRRNRRRDNLVVECHLLGMTYAEIANQLDMTRCAVAGVVHRNRTWPANPAKAKGPLSRVARAQAAA